MSAWDWYSGAVFASVGLLLVALGRRAYRTAMFACFTFGVLAVVVPVAVVMWR